MIFDGWIGGLINYSNPKLAHCTDEKLEIGNRICLKLFHGLPISTSNSDIYADTQGRSLFDQLYVKMFTAARRLLFLPEPNLFAIKFWLWKRVAPSSIWQKSYFTLEQD
jgi:hypothetical protein